MNDKFKIGYEVSMFLGLLYASSGLVYCVHMLWEVWSVV